MSTSLNSWGIILLCLEYSMRKYFYVALRLFLSLWSADPRISVSWACISSPMSCGCLILLVGILFTAWLLQSHLAWWLLSTHRVSDTVSSTYCYSLTSSSQPHQKNSLGIEEEVEAKRHQVGHTARKEERWYSIWHLTPKLLIYFYFMLHYKWVAFFFF